MKKLFPAAPLAVTLALLMPFTAALYAADTPQNNVDLEEMALKFEKKAEEDSKNELEELVQDNILKKDLEAAREQQGENREAPAATEAKEEKKKEEAPSN